MLRLQLDMTENSRRHVHQRHPISHGPVGDAHTVLGLGVLDAWLHYQTTSNSRCLPDIPFRPTARPSPNANPPALSVSSFISDDTRISPPTACDATRAARFTCFPKKSSPSLIASPVCRPMRTRMGSASTLLSARAELVEAWAEGCGSARPS